MVTWGTVTSVPPLVAAATTHLVIWAHAALALVFRDLFCHYRALKYYSNVEYPPNQQHAKILFCVWLVSFFQPTARILGTAHKN
jgi:hypothetical protein